MYAPLPLCTFDLTKIGRRSQSIFWLLNHHHHHHHLFVMSHSFIQNSCWIMYECFTSSTMKDLSKMDGETIFSGAWNSLIWQPPEHPYFTTDLRHWHYHRKKTQHIFDQFHYVLTATHFGWQFYIITNYACELTIIKFDTVAVSLLIYFHQNENCHENPSTLIKNTFVMIKCG